MRKTKICVIIPCYNEAENISSVIDDIMTVVAAEESWQVITVNDCSADNTLRALETDGRSIVLDLPCNLGVGAAVQAGFKYAVKNDFDFAFKFDGDGQHRAASLRKMLQPLKNNAADLVVGSRFLSKNTEGFQSTPLRRFGIRFFRLLIAALSGCKPSDPTSGLRGYNRKSMEFAARHYPSFDYPEPEELLLMKRNGFSILDIYTRMRERQNGVSSICFMRSIYYMLKVTFAIMMVSLRPKEKEY
ncbi:glycosyltransferase family 2 protein [Lentisphaerota bacterium ZTH]|nr:glycosyltransferase family 2 protein [Lentisphaerota bacterium]WET05740.1 glycosyltransferase family 2 protein [Lentisphaerota bacterium ZTH]